MTKYQIFTILPQISHFHKYRNFSSICCNFLDQLLHPYKFHGRDMSGILFFIFASCHPLNHKNIKFNYVVFHHNGNCCYHLKVWYQQHIPFSVDSICLQSGNPRSSTRGFTLFLLISCFDMY